MSFLLNGISTAAAGSILDTLLAEGVELPHLCKDDNLPPIGACRTCLVEADGRILAACATPAANVRVVETESPRVRELRRSVLLLTLAMQTDSDSPDQGGPLASTLSETVAGEGVGELRLEPASDDAVDASNPFFRFHESACILCGRCVSACQLLQHISAIGLAGRGRETRVIAGAGLTFGESVCTSCGSCVAACPTTALRPKTGGER
ncbi:MAG: 2Fe-2S iron-sulfur cluster-binding protein [Tepidiformaceae bacterium]